MSFIPADYETVDTRIHRFWEQYPNGRIITSIHALTETGGIFKAEIYTDREDVIPVTVDFAEETKGSSPVNRTSWVENGLTSAIGRALADLGFSPKGQNKRPTQEEMGKVERAKNFDWVAEAKSKTLADEVRSVYARAKTAGAAPDVLTQIQEFGKTLVN